MSRLQWEKNDTHFWILVKRSTIWISNNKYWRTMAVTITMNMFLAMQYRDATLLLSYMHTLTAHWSFEWVVAREFQFTRAQKRQIDIFLHWFESQKNQNERIDRAGNTRIIRSCAHLLQYIELRITVERINYIWQVKHGAFIVLCCRTRWNPRIASSFMVINRSIAKFAESLNCVWNSHIECGWIGSLEFIASILIRAIRRGIQK